MDSNPSKPQIEHDCALNIYTQQEVSKITQGGKGLCLKSELYSRLEE